MKRFLLFFVAVLALVGCNNAFEDEHSARLEQNVLPTLMAGFEDATRTYVEQDTYLRWHTDDRLTIFYGNTLNRQYKFNGNTGDNSGSFTHVPSGNIETGNSFDHIYAVYPYDANISLDDINKSISLTLPAEQEYAENSFGKGANTMVAVTKDVDDTFLAFKNACGYLKVKLYGDATVKSIELKGNNGEKIAGNASITATYGGVPTVAMAEDATESITLDCGEGVKLSTDAEKPTEFWFVVPPTEFSDGLTIVATDIYGTTFVKSTSNAVTITRNEIQPMAALEAIFRAPTKPAYNEIWYTSSDGKIIKPYNKNVFGANIVSNNYKDGKGVITFDGDVTTIGNCAFEDCYRLTSVTIPDSVTTIGYSAFEDCSSLTSVTIGDSVTTIGDYAFLYCDSLTSVYITDLASWCKIDFYSGKSNPIVGGATLYLNGEPITDLVIPDSVTTIGNYAFYNCNSLTSVTIGDSVTTIGYLAFYWCSSLTSVTIGDSVTTIGNYAFEGCDSLTSVTIGDSVTTIGERAFYRCTSLTSVTIPDSVTTIGYSAFEDCSSLTSVTIGDSVTTIGDYAFWYCDSLTSVTIGDSVTTIGNYAFRYCSSLTSVTIPDSVTTIGDAAFEDCSSLTSVTIGDSVTTIGDAAFEDCSSLTSVYITDLASWCKIDFYSNRSNPIVGGATLYLNGEPITDLVIPDSVTTIGNYAFYNCDSLTSVTIGDSVTTIGDYAFGACNSLTSVTIGDSVTTIGEYAFAWCKSLTSVTIGDSVTTIGDYAFWYCDNLTSVYSKPTTPPSFGGYYVFSYTNIQAIYVPTGSVEAYKTASYWKSYAYKIEGYDF